ncbi:hypothetical protein [Wielerella bovis]|uniref:hypothetical protein n=1 Tax=Wielerella bovis TaxID=2917790 RepID=UPI002018F029|nr:hypothetical protein [Wielerella bovis]MCG7657915.1 hypothetical protein [Wielerella bovis]MCG7660137.1 hypothetical protein [Wielerella bovis]
MLEPTHSRQTARVQTWDGKVGMAQTQDGGIYEMTIETMDYAPVQVGDKIEIFWFDGKIESWRIAPKVGQTETLDYAELSQMSGRQFFAKRSQILLRELYHFLSLILFLCILAMILPDFSWTNILGGIVGYTVVRIIDLALFGLRKTWAWTENDSAIIVSRYAEVNQCNAYLQWHDIASAEIRKTRFFRFKYLHITPKKHIRQPEIKLALFLLDKQVQDETLHIIQKRIQAA